MTAVRADRLRVGDRLRDFWSPTFVVAVVPTQPRNGRGMVTVTFHQPERAQTGQGECSGRYDLPADYVLDIWPRQNADSGPATDSAAQV
jgi:hypothetical protein